MTKSNLYRDIEVPAILVFVYRMKCKLIARGWFIDTGCSVCKVWWVAEEKRLDELGCRGGLRVG